MNPYLLQGNSNHLTVDNKIYQEKIIKLIRHRFGIIIHSHQLKELTKICSGACAKFSLSAEDYLKALAEDPESSPLLDDLMSKITVGETYFFRDKNQVNLLKEMILPTLIEKKRSTHDLNLRIWSAGCASGEEIYTIAMLLSELLTDFEKWKIQLLATDINTVALKKGLTGIYYEWSMRSIHDYYKNKFFVRENNAYHLIEDIRDKVDFAYLNLNDNTYPSIFNGTNAKDLIVCRNVLIYFDEDTIRHIMKRICASLLEDGYIMFGASDPMLVKNLDLDFVKNSLYIHRKPSHHAMQIHEKPELRPLPVKSNLATYKPKKLPHITNDASSRDVTYESIKKLVLSLVNDGQWHEALKAIDNYKHYKIDTFILNVNATVLANLGNLEDAIELCEESIQIDPINIQTHFILAMSLVELNKMTAAENELRKVIFLDNNYVQAHFQLGLLLLRIKKYDMGIKSLKNALAIAKSFDQTTLVSDFDALNYGKLTEILQREIELYQHIKG